MQNVYLLDRFAIHLEKFAIQQKDTSYNIVG